MNTISVIGGSGFIGTRLCNRFYNNGVNFKIIDKKISETFPDKTIIADVRNIEKLRESIEGECVINLAAEHRDDVTPKSLYDEVNVGGAENVCKVVEEKKINKMIFTSSVAVYGFAPVGTDEKGELRPFNDYGRTKMLAEKVYADWYNRDPDKRVLVIIRPTVVFGEGNRGNVYNLLNQMANGTFIMVGNGKNVKSMAYVENVAAFIEYSLSFGPGIHIYNYVDKPDFDINTLVQTIYSELNKRNERNKPNKRNKRYKRKISIPYPIGLLAGKLFDFISLATGKRLPISSIRIKKFCSNTCFGTSIPKTGFVPPISLKDGLIRTICYEFFESHPDEPVFVTE